MRSLETHDLPPSAKVIPPKAGWTEDTEYLVKVSFASNNPIHLAVLFVGYLDEEGEPGNYSEIYSNNFDQSYKFGAAYYLEVVGELVVKLEPDPRVKSNVLVNHGALNVAMRSLRRGTPIQNEIADGLEETVLIPEPCAACNGTGEVETGIGMFGCGVCNGITYSFPGV